MSLKKNKGLKNRKIRLFVIFLSCSSLIWFVSKLSGTYANNVVFNLTFENSNDSLLLNGTSTKRVDAKIRASGFTFFGMAFKRNLVVLDASVPLVKNGGYYLSPELVRYQLQHQLPQSVEVMEVDQKDILLDFQTLLNKKVPVVPNVDMKLAQNFLLEGKLILEPDSIKVSGPKNEVDTLRAVSTEKLSLKDVDGDIETKIKLKKEERLSHTRYSSTDITIKGKVSEFSEKLIEVPVQIINVPEGAKVRCFPSSVTVLCRAPVPVLAKLSPEDFEVVADIAKEGKGKEGLLELVLTRSPETVFSTTLSQNAVEYLINVSQ